MAHATLLPGREGEAWRPRYAGVEHQQGWRGLSRPAVDSSTVTAGAGRACRHVQRETPRPAYEEARLEMPTVRVVLKHPEQGDTQKIYHEVDAHISTNNILHITRGGGDAIAEFQADAYLYWEYVDDAAGQPER